MHNFDETWMSVPLWYKKKIKSDEKTADINTKNLEVSSLFNDTSKTAKITWFLLVPHRPWL